MPNYSSGSTPFPMAEYLQAFQNKYANDERRNDQLNQSISGGFTKGVDYAMDAYQKQVEQERTIILNQVQEVFKNNDVYFGEDVAPAGMQAQALKLIANGKGGMRTVYDKDGVNNGYELINKKGKSLNIFLKPKMKPMYAQSEETGELTPMGSIPENADVIKTGSKDTDKDTFNMEKDLRDSFRKDVGDFTVIRDAYSRIQATANTPSAAGDIALIYAFMRINDPRSTVREGEYATAESAGPLNQKYYVLYNKLLTGERLTPKMRADFLSQSKNMYKRMEGQYDQTKGYYTKLAQRYKVAPENVIIDYGLSNQPLSNSEPKPDQYGYTIGETQQFGEKTLKYIGNNQWSD